MMNRSIEEKNKVGNLDVSLLPAVGSHRRRDISFHKNRVEEESNKLEGHMICL